jgi:hypothetical protein
MTRTMEPQAFSQDCGCGAMAGQPCPHTPIRCPHSWSYVDLRGGKRLKTDMRDVGDVRTCAFCGRVERAKIGWDTVVA